jgi:ATP-dependent phosphofructokinase / diphosphate-dependent phosphofructokinase
MGKLKGNVLIGQSGGPTAVINQSLLGVFEQARRDPRVRQVLGARHGVRGMLEDKCVRLDKQPAAALAAIAKQPGAALGSVRKKPTEEESVRIVEFCRKRDVRWLYYIGGNDSAETAQLLEKVAERSTWEMQIFHVPKTIDNDLCETDHCPGYGSAARFVALALMGDDLDSRALPGIKIDVIMGRNAGWLTAASALARVRADDGPHLVYVPERTFDLDAFACDVEAVRQRLGRCVVAVSEGVRGADGKTVAVTKEVDAHGNAVLSGSGALGDFLAAELKRRLGDKLRVRADTFGYLQRSFYGCVSSSDAREARAVGRAAVRFAREGGPRSGSVVIRRVPGKNYRVEYGWVELERVAHVTQALPERYLGRGADVSAEFLAYARPLAGALPRPVVLP